MQYLGKIINIQCHVKKKGTELPIMSAIWQRICFFYALPHPGNLSSGKKVLGEPSLFLLHPPLPRLRFFSPIHFSCIKFNSTSFYVFRFKFLDHRCISTTCWQFLFQTFICNIVGPMCKVLCHLVSAKTACSLHRSRHWH